MFLSAAPQTPPANPRAALCHAIIPIHSQYFLVYAEASWTKQCCQQGPEASPAALTKLKIRTAISHAVELQEMLFSRGAQRSHPGSAIINRSVHLPSFLGFLAPTHEHCLDFPNGKSRNKADSEKLGQQLKSLPKRNLFAQAKAVLSPNMGVIILQPFAWKTMKGRRNRLGNCSLPQ